MTGARELPRLRRLAEQIHDLGSRPLLELFAELVDQHGDRVLDRLEAYARLPTGFIAANGGRDLRKARRVA
jgi:uncharacterized protein YfbU (UPF0304 family)